MQDVLTIGFLAVAGPLVIVAPVSFALHYFIALGSPPTQRAAWTAGIAYLAAAAILMFGGPAGYEAWAPLVALPSGLIAFWFWRSDFRRGWIENPEALPDGMTIANDDWRIGILQLLAFVTLAAGIAIARVLINGF